MNIKERVEQWKKTSNYGYEEYLPDWLLREIGTELERLWKMEECAQRVHEIKKEPYQYGTLSKAVEQLDKALAAEGQK